MLTLAVSLLVVVLTTFVLLIIRCNELHRRLKHAQSQLHVEHETLKDVTTRLDEAQAKLQELSVQRADERKGRIRLQQKLREQEQQKQTREGYQFKPVAVVHSPFADRRGTPRQPQLVPDGKASIRFVKTMNMDYWSDLQGFSHIWVLFVFHQNTNVGSESVKAKAQPPRLGKKISVFSTRSPHRPNPIGLSVVEIAGIDNRGIHIRSADFVDGTPVLDVKPYIPYDIVGSYRVPDWVQEQLVEKKDVVFDVQCLTMVEQAIEQRELQFYEDEKEFLNFVTQVLRQDIRSVHQGRGETTTRPYRCRLDNIEFVFTVNADFINVSSCRIVVDRTHEEQEQDEQQEDDEVGDGDSDVGVGATAVVKAEVGERKEEMAAERQIQKADQI